MTPGQLQAMFKDFTKEARRLQEKYKDKISTIAGLETDVIREDSFDRIRRLKDEYQLDYVVGSVHHIDGIPIDASLELFEKAEDVAGGTEDVMCRYFDQQYSLLQEVKADIIGHFDLIRLHRPEFEITDLIWKKVTRNIDLGISYGALFEINTGGASPYKKLMHPYPHPKILEVSDIILLQSNLYKQPLLNSHPPLGGQESKSRRGTTISNSQGWPLNRG